MQGPWTDAGCVVSPPTTAPCLGGHLTCRGLPGPWSLMWGLGQLMSQGIKKLFPRAEDPDF